MTTDDISGGLDATNYVVTGFFTPDYREMARGFASNLAAHSIPRMLYSWEPGSWQASTLAKPVVVLRAMRDFPNRTIVLMDVDCEVRGPVGSILDFAADVSLFIGVGLHPQNEPGWRMRAIPSSRIIVFKQTSGARQLLASWQEFCDDGESEISDEMLLMRAIGVTQGLTLAMLDRRFAARNPWDCPIDAVIVHNTVSRLSPSRGLHSKP